jgi:hypothetical protein
MAGCCGGKAAGFKKSRGFYIGDDPGRRVLINDDAINYP